MVDKFVDIRDFVCATCGNNQVTLNRQWILSCHKGHYTQLKKGSVVYLDKSGVKITFPSDGVKNGSWLSEYLAYVQDGSIKP